MKKSELRRQNEEAKASGMESAWKRFLVLKAMAGSPARGGWQRLEGTMFFDNYT